MTINTNDVRDVINNPEGRTPYPEDTVLLTSNGSGSDSTVSDADTQAILNRLTTLEAKKDKYNSFVTEYKLMGTIDLDGKEVAASSGEASYGVTLGPYFTDKTGEHPDAIVKLTYFSPSFKFGGVTITDGDSSKAYDIHIPALAFDIPFYEPYGNASTSQVIVPISRLNSNSLIRDHREIRAIVNATIEYEIVGEDLASGGYIGSVTPNSRGFRVHGINLSLDIFNKTSDDVIHRASIVTEYGFDVGSGNGDLSAPTTNSTPTRYNCSLQSDGATFNSVLQEGAGATNCVRIIHTKLNED